MKNAILFGFDDSVTSSIFKNGKNVHYSIRFPLLVNTMMSFNYKIDIQINHLCGIIIILIFVRRAFETIQIMTDQSD